MEVEDENLVFVLVGVIKGGGKPMHNWEENPWHS